MYQYVKEFGGYFKRFNGGLLSPWVKPSPPSTGAREMDLHARATLTFFEVRAIQSPDIFLSNVRQTVTSIGRQKPRGRSCRKGVRIHRLRCYPSIFGSSFSPLLLIAEGGFDYCSRGVNDNSIFFMFKLITGHRSDTRILLCSSHNGTAYAMTENHRVEGRMESVRLRRMMGTGVIADSFGDVRCVQSVSWGKRKGEYSEGGWAPSKIHGGGCLPRVTLGATTANWHPA